MTRIVAAITVLMLVAAGLYYPFFYPPSVLKRATANALEQFADTVASKDRAKIGEALQTFLADDAKIHLEVTFFSLTQQNNPAVVQDFDRASFIRFVDNVLYPLTDYAYQPRLETFAAADDRQSASITFSSKDWADGNSLYGGISVGMRFSTDTQCTGDVMFADEQPRLKTADCKLLLRSVPRPGEAGKLRSPEQLRELLKP